MKCLKCGAELSADTKFCSYCGHKVEDTMPPPPVPEKDEIPPIPHAEPVKADKEKASAKESLADKAKDKGIESWNKLSLYGKVTTVAILGFVILCLVALLSGKAAAVVIAVGQIALAVVSILMHEGIIKLEKKKLWLKWLVLGIAILFTVLNVMSYSWGRKVPTSVQSSSSTNETVKSKPEQVDWANIVLSNVLPEPQSNMMEIINNGEDWLNVNVHELSENDFLEYVRWCKDDYGFTVDSNSFDGCFYAFNQEKYCVTLIYDKATNVLSFNLEPPTENISENPETDKRTEKNGFDSSTNEDYRLAGYTVEIPKYWKSERQIPDGIQRYAETSGKVAMIQISAQEETDDSYPVTFDGLMDDNDNMIAMIESTAFSEVTDYEVIDTGVIKGILYKGNIKEIESGLTSYGEWFSFASEEDRNWCTLIMTQTDNTEYLYTEDFMKMLMSIKPVEKNAVTESITEVETSTPEQEVTDEPIEPETNLTVDNCPELAAMLSNKAEIDESYSSFAAKYSGRIIEFDGRIDYCTKHGNYNTRFDYLVSAGDYDPDHQVGPFFKFEDVNYYDLNTDLDTVSVGLNVHIVAEVESFNSNSGLFYLAPVSITER